MRVSTVLLQQKGTESLLRQQSEALKTQLQIASGKRILNPADDPAGAAKVLDLQQAIGVIDRYQDNIGGVESRLALEESVLDGVTDLVIRMKELAIQGANATQSPDSLKGILAEVEEHLETLVQLANTSDGNEYLFAGYKSKTIPFTETVGTFTYNGDQGVRMTQVGPSRQIAETDSGYEVFMDIKDGNGTFTTAPVHSNTGTGIITVGTVTDSTAWVPDTYQVNFQTDSSGNLEYYVVQDPLGTPTQISPTPNLRASADSSNAGTGTIALDFTGANEADAEYYIPIDIVFTGANDFNIVNANTSAVLDSVTGYVAGTDIFPADGGWDPGYQAQISNAPQTGDSFRIERNGTTFTDGDTIAFNGIEFEITGEPIVGDLFTIDESSNQSMFETFKALADALRMPQDNSSQTSIFHSAMGKVMEELNLALTNNNRVQAEIGARMKAVEAEYEANTGAVLALRENLSSVQDLDMAEAITKYELQLVSLQAAQQSYAKIQGLKLFDYIQ